MKGKAGEGGAGARAGSVADTNPTARPAKARLPHSPTGQAKMRKATRGCARPFAETERARRLSARRALAGGHVLAQADTEVEARLRHDEIAEV